MAGENSAIKHLMKETNQIIQSYPSTKTDRKELFFYRKK
jgi:hypothetical protein